MSGLTLVLFILSLFSASSAFDRKTATEKLADYRIDSQNIQIDHLEEEIHHLEEEFQQLSKPLGEKEIRKLKSRLFQNEVVISGINDTIISGSSCEKHEVPCGPGASECVGNMFFCDGRKDCRNGEDEDPVTCSTEPVTAGISYLGWANWKWCYNEPDHFFRLTIVDVRRLSDAHGSLFFTWNSDAFINPETANPTHFNPSTGTGYYEFATQQLVVIGSRDGPFAFIGMTCNFLNGIHDYTSCVLFREASDNSCGPAYMIRV